MTSASKRLSLGLSLAVLLSLVGSVVPTGAAQPIDVDFTASPTRGYAPLTVNFEDQTSIVFGLGSLDWSPAHLSSISCFEQTWDFGDGSTASRIVDGPVDPFDTTHVYTQPGTYTVTLTYDDTQCRNDASILPTSLDVRHKRSYDYSKTIEFYIVVLAPVEEKDRDRPPEPANLYVSNLDVNPTQVVPGQEVVISANVCNSGGQKGSMTATLMLNGNVEQSQTVGVGPGGCQPVVFKVYKTYPTTYQVAVGGMQGQFSVMAPRLVQESVPSQQDNGLGTPGIIAIIVIVVVLIGALILIFRT